MAARHARNNGQDAKVRLAKIGGEAFALTDARALLAKIGKTFDLRDGKPLPRPGGGPHAAPLHQEHQYHRQDHNQKQHSDCVYQYHRTEAVTVKQNPVITREYCYHLNS